LTATAALYDRMFRRLEKARWSLSDIRFDEVDKARVAPQELMFLRVNCLMELSSLYAVRMFLRDFRELPDFCQFMSIWYYEEMKHYLVLREYLKLWDKEPDAASLGNYDTELTPAPWPPTLALHYVGELRLGMWYRRWSDEADEPVLSQIYRLIGNDEVRHAGCYKEFMEQAAADHPELLLDFMQTCKWMLFNPAGDKHPTTMKADRAHDQAVTDRIEGYADFQKKILATIHEDDEAELRRQVLTTLSRLAGQPITTMVELASYTRRLTREQRPQPVPTPFIESASRSIAAEG
jgi:hypothetical protein